MLPVFYLVKKINKKWKTVPILLFARKRNSKLKWKHKKICAIQNGNPPFQIHVPYYKLHHQILWNKLNTADENP